mgnify:CR=1 FL=1
MNEKLVNVKRLSDGRPFRFPKSQADAMLALTNEDGSRKFSKTSKSYGRSYYRRAAQVIANRDYMEAHGISVSKDQNDHFCTQEGRKIVAHIYRGTKTHKYQMPTDPEKAKEKRTWVEGLVEKACINPHNGELRSSLLAKLAILLGFKKLFEKKADQPEFEEKEVQLPYYERRLFGYGDIKDHKNILIA